jgi:predicted membrane protein
MSSRAGLGVVLLAGGALWLLAATDLVDLSYGAAIGILLILIGIVIAVTPGRHGPLVLIGILVALAGVPALFVDSDLWDEGVGDAREEPASTSDLVPFEHGVGKLTVDLTADELDLDGAVVEARLGIGDLEVILPADVDVDLDAHVGAGNIDAFGEEENGFDVDVNGISGTSGSKELDLVAEVGIGNLRVRFAP